jgi:hypothetical protein
MNEMQMELTIIYAHDSSQSSRANARATLLVVINGYCIHYLEV